MDAKTAAAYLSENLTAAYGTALARLYDKTDAEDLAGEMICEILASAENLKSQDTFWGFAWKIAENTFRKFIRKKQLLDALCDMPEENAYVRQSNISIRTDSLPLFREIRQQTGRNLHLMML